MDTQTPNPPLEEQKKAILPLLTRAQEIQSADPKVAYYCRLNAVEQAIHFPRRAKDIEGVMMSTLARLEKDKKQLVLDPENDRWHCEAFALKIFDNADRADRAGRGDLNTAKAFYAASLFLDILNQFGEVPPDVLEKQRYAVWRAAEIRKAAREGRPPVPPSGQAPTTPSAGSTPTDTAGLGLSNSAGQLGGTWGEPTSSNGLAGHPNLPPLVSRTNSSGEAVPAVQSLPWLPPSSQAPRSGRASGSGGTEGAEGSLPGPMDTYNSNTPAAIRPGTRLMVRADDGTMQNGTVGQVYTGPDGVTRYKVALADRFVFVTDADLVPLVPPEGHSLQPPNPPGEADRSGPYLVNTMDESVRPGGDRNERNANERTVTSTQVPFSIVEQLPPTLWNRPTSDPDQPAPPGADPAYHLNFTPAPVAPPHRPPTPPRQPDHVFPAVRAFTQPPAVPYANGPAASLTQVPPPTEGTLDLPCHTGHARLMQTVQATAAAAAVAVTPPAVPGYKPDLTAITSAQKAAKHAVSSLSFDDVTTAVKYLQEALGLLTRPS